jgi:hypothetical protein
VKTKRKRGGFEHTTGKSLAKAVGKSDRRLWAQTHSAFEVRHLIEHTKGKVDRKFIEKVVLDDRWKTSSWADLPVAKDKRIEIREKDFNATYEAMAAAAEIIAGLTMDCWVE